MSQMSLISMNKEEAVVAEQVVTYKRADVKEKYEVIKQQVMTDREELPRLQKLCSETEARLAANSYTLELYEALLEAFNRNYPEQVQEVEQPKETVEAAPIQEEPVPAQNIVSEESTQNTEAPLSE